MISNNQILRINNILICLCIFIFNKINLDIFTSVSMNVPLVEGRGLEQNIIFNKKNIKFIDESYNASPKSMKTAIDFFSDLKTNKNQKKFLILGDMKELGKYSNFYHKDLLNYIYNKKLENIIICGECMKIALDKNISRNFILMLDKDIILRYLDKNLSNNDIILIKGSNSSITNEVAKNLLKRKVN
jgi:UDP-N-acetylmuramyl pentapeptide synthase